MRVIDVNNIITALSDGIATSLTHVESGVNCLLEKALRDETNENCKWAISQILENNAIAAKTHSYACQDCGLAVLFVTIGQDVTFSASLAIAFNKAVELGYKSARKSVADPLTRLNTHTNTPAIIHYDIVDGDEFSVSYLAKGAGSENMSKVYMLTPSKGVDGIVSSCLDAVRNAGANPCPPIILGVGIGGDMEKCAILSKKALLVNADFINPDPALRELESRILAEVNALKIGAQGYGGKITALAVHAQSFPTHIGMLPVAVNIQCHSVRHFTLSL